MAVVIGSALKLSCEELIDLKKTTFIYDVYNA
jgi:hypothetical protein